MQITVALFGHPKDMARTSNLEVRLVERATIQGLLDRLGTRFGPLFQHSVVQENGDIWPEIAILHNGVNIFLGQGLATPLEEGDVVSIIPVISGG
jgi:MoaD family protein